MNNKRNIIVLVGEAASGKDTIEIALEKHCGVKRLVSHTSRPMRKGEIEGENYYYRSSEELKDMIEKKLTAENTTYVVNGETWYYALSIEALNNIPNGSFGVVTVNPHGVQQLIKNKEIKDRLIVIRIKTNIKDRERRYFEREAGSENIEQRWEARLEQDNEDFEWFDRILEDRIVDSGVPLFTYLNTHTEEIDYDNIAKRVMKRVEHYTSFETYIKDQLEIMLLGNELINRDDKEYYMLVYHLFYVIMFQNWTTDDILQEIYYNYINMEGDVFI